jgi:hypothetical protein
MAEGVTKQLTTDDADKAFNDGSYRIVPESYLRELERLCVNASSQNPAFRERMKMLTERFKEELKKREARRAASAAMPTTETPEAEAGEKAGISSSDDGWDAARVRALVAASVPESLTMEYKAGGALRREPRAMDEMTKDASAMANSAGGILIYGIAEDSGTHELSLVPVNGAEFSREWLEQVLSQVSPRIPGLRIHPVDIGPAGNQVVYVVEIPKSSTAHQARDLKYYARRNFQSVAMQDHEIRDVMSRTKHPKLVVKAELVVYDTRNTEGNHGVLALKITNDSEVFARYLSVVVDAPPRVGANHVHYKDATYEQLPGGSRYRCSFSNHHGPPLFPKAVLMPLFPFVFVTPVGPATEQDLELDHFKVVAFADSMPKETLVFRPEDILKTKAKRPS